MSYTQDQYFDSGYPQSVPPPSHRRALTTPVVPHFSNFVPQANQPPQIASQTPFMPPTQENWGLRQNLKKQYVDNEARFKQDAANRYWAKQQQSVLNGPPPPSGIAYKPYSGGDGSFNAPQQPAAYFAPPRPQQAPQQGPEFDDYTLRAWHQYQQQFHDGRSLRDFATTFKPQQDKLDQQANAAYANPNYGKSYDQSLADTRRASAQNVAGVKAAMDRFPANRPGGPLPPASMNPQASLPSTTPPPPVTPAGGGGQGGLQGVGIGHLPNSDMVQGEALDAMGAKMGIPRGTSSINGQSSGPRTDAEYAGLLRSEAQRRYLASKDYENEPGYAKVAGELDTANKADAAGIPIPAAIRQQRADDDYYSMTPEQRAQADATPAEKVATIKTDAAKAIATDKNAIASKGIDMKAYSEFGKNVANIAKAGINSFTSWLNTNTRASTSRANAQGHDETRLAMTDKNNDTKTGIADKSDATKNRAIDSKTANVAANRAVRSEADKRKIALQVEKMTDLFAKQIAATVTDEKLRAKAIEFHRNSLLRSAGLDDWATDKPAQQVAPAPAAPQTPAQPQQAAPALTPNPDGTFSHPDHPGAKYRKVDGGYQKVS